MKRCGLAVVFALAVAVTVVGAEGTQDLLFEFEILEGEGLMLFNVPDAGQPMDNYCAPISAANALVFLAENEVPWAPGFGDRFHPSDLSENLGFLMCTNGAGSHERKNAELQLPGTITADIPGGFREYVRCDQAHSCDVPAPDAIPERGTDLGVKLVQGDPGGELLEALIGSIEKGIPPIICFNYWNPHQIVEMELGWIERDLRENLSFCTWGEPLGSTEELHKKNPKVPLEQWNKSEKAMVGHAVTGVGFAKGDPDSDGPLPETLWVIVHDNWSTTPRNIVIPLENVHGVVVYGP